MNFPTIDEVLAHIADFDDDEEVNVTSIQH